MNFKEYIPEEIHILDNKILDNKPNNQILKEKVDKEILDKLDYDDTPPVDDEGNLIRFNDKSSDSNSKLHKKQAENRKKK